MAESLRELAIELKKAKPIKDSGERTQFATGAVRDMHEGKGRFDLLPMCQCMTMYFPSSARTAAQR